MTRVRVDIVAPSFREVPEGQARPVTLPAETCRARGCKLPATRRVYLNFGYPYLPEDVIACCDRHAAESRHMETWGRRVDLAYIEDDRERAIAEIQEARGSD